MSDQTPIRIVIVGGGAGAISAATRARRLGENASIIVLEKGSEINSANRSGSDARGEAVKNEESSASQSAAVLETRFNIDVRLRNELLQIFPSQHEVELRDLDKNTTSVLAYDKLILSQEAQRFRPQIKGIDQPHVFTLQTIADHQAVKSYILQHGCQSVAIIGGGRIGLAAAETFRLLGLRVSIVEAAPQVFAPFDRDLAEVLHAELRRNQVDLHLSAQVRKVEASAVLLEDQPSVPADVVLVAADGRPDCDIPKKAGLAVGKQGLSVNVFMQTSQPEIYAVGEMAETENRISHQPQRLTSGGPASRQGRLAANHIFGRATPYPGNLGTVVCKVFDFTASVTGLSTQALRDFGYSPLWVTVHPPDMTLRVAFEPGSGKLLGGQAVGRQGIDQRIDVLSLALHAEMTIFDLEHAELGYAPAYSSAKDPVNLAGFVGSNMLRGDLKIIHPEDLHPARNEFQVVDVRSPAEFLAGHLHSAENIPIDALRKRASKLNKHRAVLVYSSAGYRGYLAYRILHQLGFSALNLDGGFKVVTEGGFKGLQTIYDH
ncbi:hypothetical protein P175DRAFT_0478624 [Aspergillus ochraceoroseus IBT 24754]|uniref:Rhodanese domain-containing protein n=2 Tax=Aspergillus ochraceoroseus TaxID=138278 RepID=A0A2T5LWI8_9EURO|nr:uncharacterized protein P175DRAFT_0478624 [Aspergillus ochraceoroseus IBT 24754]KKK13059.1 hypothetical protein AOCH_003083 [Aspergillus ochraceoroseus]PTU20613.1 hypothetical protein P175DRAFT_0478624 [Aspergillus ochraceoroseus IBT 24754]